MLFTKCECDFCCIIISKENIMTIVIIIKKFGVMRDIMKIRLILFSSDVSTRRPGRYAPLQCVDDVFVSISDRGFGSRIK